ncbi:hypothetical protein HNQ91_003587 [Filimonas zeae]|nr:hypothetical protein [Filimonas zeae]MDR6340522.1 hypothetical protein [Filimonas zeae]
MKILFSALLSALCISSLTAQHSNTWYMYYNGDSSLTGYKDARGNVMITPQFSGLTYAHRFDDIIAVTVETKGMWNSYYLTKSGRITGTDSLYIYDNTSDCECEGFIRFHDKKTDRAGLFNSRGQVAVPAQYNALSNVKNGMLSGLMDAKKEYWDNDATKHAHEHFSWKGGREVLLDTLNNVLIAAFTSGHTLNFYSLQKHRTPSTDKRRKNFKATDGLYYSFLDYEQEFNAWFADSLMPGLNQARLTATAQDSIVWFGADGWEKTERVAFISKNFAVLQTALQKANSHPAQLSVFKERLNPYLYEGPEWQQYFDNCGNAKEWRYPVMQLVYSYTIDGNTVQNHFDFLRTESGYRLIGVSIPPTKEFAGIYSISIK